MRSSTRWTAVLLPLALLAACSDDDSETVSSSEPSASAAEESIPPDVDLSDFNQGEIPDERPKGDLSALPAEPGDSEPLEDRLAWEALEAVTEFADRVDPDASASCPAISGDSSEIVVCTVDFYGKEYEYEIIYDSQGTGLSDGENESRIVTYDAELTHVPIFRDRVESILRFEHGTEYVACNMGDHARIARNGPDSELFMSSGDDLFTGFICRVLDVDTGEVTELGLEMSDRGAPVFVDDPF